MNTLATQLDTIKTATTSRDASTGTWYHGMISILAPGPINTPLVRSLSEDWQRAKAAELPLGRFGEPEEVANTVAFLCSPGASLFVGQTLGPNSGDVML